MPVYRVTERSVWERQYRVEADTPAQASATLINNPEIEPEKVARVSRPEQISTEPYPEDDEPVGIQALLACVGYLFDLATIQSWSVVQQEEACAWAAMTYLYASDHDDITPPEKPGWLDSQPQLAPEA